MPMTWPSTLNKRAAGIARIDGRIGLNEGHVASRPSGRAVALTTPAVTLFSKPNGEPIATTH